MNSTEKLDDLFQHDDQVMLVDMMIWLKNDTKPKRMTPKYLKPMSSAGKDVLTMTFSECVTWGSGKVMICMPGRDYPSYFQDNPDRTDEKLKQNIILMNELSIQITKHTKEQ
eukprot:310378_1